MLDGHHAANQTMKKRDARRQPSAKPQASKWLTLIAAFVALKLFALQRGSNCLKISSIEVPAAVWNGSEATFVCNYELAQDDQLYSVKWYKNYVEFYRFLAGAQSQPHWQPLERPLESAQDSLQAGQMGQNLNLNQVATGARHAFDWDGINLDLAKSNATHVHLREFNLSSEATFRCEVSADSPTFATVSAERQMKVYVLAKQKLALVDNSNWSSNWDTSASFNANSNLQQAGQTSSSKPSQNNDPKIAARIQNNAKQPVYQLNDLLNFTCVAGASRPGARLSWLLNEAELVVGTPPPPPTPQSPPTGRSSSATARLRANDIKEELRMLPNGLVESRSQLTLRLEASHLKLLRKQAGGGGPSQRNQMVLAGHSSSVLPVRLACLSRLSVEFSSETNVLVSSGQMASSAARPTAKRRNNPDDTSRSGKVLPPLASSLVDSPNEPDERTEGARSRRRNHLVAPETTASQSSELEAEPQNSFRWPPPPSGQQAGANVWAQEVGGGGGGGNERETQEARRQPARTRHNVVWTQRQLQAQADHIERLLLRSRPNELEAPHVEASSMRRDVGAKLASTVLPTTNSQDNDNNQNQNGGGGGSGGEPEEEEERSTPSSPSIVISSNQFDMLAELATSGGAGDKFEHRQLDKDYELGELVNFTCLPVFARDTHKQAASVSALYSVQVKWFINNQEISGNQVNHFDGERFYLRTTSDNKNVEQNGPNGQQQHQGANEARWLLVEFSSSLLQLKELTLKCKTIVEQTLVEQESAQVFSLLASPYIQASQEQLLGQRTGRPSMYNVREPQQRQSPGARYHQSATIGPTNSHEYGQSAAGGATGAHRTNVIRMRQSQQARSQSARPPQLHPFGWPLVSLVTLLTWLARVPLHAGASRSFPLC